MVCLVHRRMQLLALPSVHFHFRWVSRFVCIEKSNPILCWGAFLLWLSHILIIITTTTMMVMMLCRCFEDASKAHILNSIYFSILFCCFVAKKDKQKIFSDRAEKQISKSISKAPFILCEALLWKREPWRDEKEEKLETQTLFSCHWASSSTSFTKGCEEKLSS